MCCRFLAQSEIWRGGRLNALFLPGMDVMCLEGASASVTPRASSGYHESPAGNRNLFEVSQHDQHNRKKA
jgi:hypothetical protein